MANLKDVCTLHARQGWHQELGAVIAVCLCDADCCQRLGQGLLLCRWGMLVSASEASRPLCCRAGLQTASITRLLSEDFGKHQEAPTLS